MPRVEVTGHGLVSGTMHTSAIEVCLVPRFGAPVWPCYLREFTLVVIIHSGN